MTFALLGLFGYLVPKGLWVPILLIFVVHARTLKAMTAGDFTSLLKNNAIFLAVPFYALLSAVWAVEPAIAAKTSVKLLGYVIAAAFIVIVVQRTTNQEKRSILIWTAVGLIAGQSIVWIDLAMDGALLSFARTDPFIASSYNRGVAIGACTILPVAIGLWRLSLRPLAIAFAVLTTVTVFVAESEAAKLALVAGGALYFSVRYFRRLYWPVMGIMLAAFVAMPAVFSVNFSDKTYCLLSEYKFSAVHRLMIYKYSSERIAEKPVAGWGMDSARSIPSGKGMAFIADCALTSRSDKRLQIGNWMPLHPHSAALQAWLELGFIGVALIFAGLVQLARIGGGASANPQNRALFAGVFASLFMIFNISFGFWQGWLLFGMVLLCALMTVNTRLGAIDRPPGAETT